MTYELRRVIVDFFATLGYTSQRITIMVALIYNYDKAY